MNYSRGAGKHPTRPSDRGPHTGGGQTKDEESAEGTRRMTTIAKSS